MADEEKIEEEYRYPEEELGEGDASTVNHYDDGDEYNADVEVQQGGGLMDRVTGLFRNRVVLIGLVVIAIFVVLQFMTGKKTTTKAVQATATQEPKQAVAQSSQVANRQFDNQLQQQVASQSQASSQIMSNVSSMDSQIKTNRNQISSIQDQMANLQQALQSVSNNSQTTNEAISELALSIKKLAADQKKKETPKPKVIPPKPVTYYIRAVVPGRAWIYGTNKRSASIIVGDTVNQYGKVLAINPDQGVIVTSSGKTISFSSLDQ